MNILWYTVLCISTSITTMGAFMVYHACECIPAGRTPWGLMEHYYVLSYDSWKLFLITQVRKAKLKKLLLNNSHIYVPEGASHSV